MKDLFDLNIEKVLEHWEVKHAVREIIANAIDEQILTKSSDVEIYKKNGAWIIRDYGRGIQSFHFTQNENKEKLQAPNLIGKFGVGLKDALAVFYRKNIDVVIDSKYAHITIQMADKAGFNIQTLHAVFSDPIDSEMKGTEFTLRGVSDQEIEDAKAMFLRFAKYNKPLEVTRYGEVYIKSDDTANIYINGVLVATEENFLFSYNITNISAQVKKALNRERSNVGRTAYSDSVKNILKNCKSKDVLLTLVEDIDNVMRGTNKDESGWVDVASYAVRTLNKTDEVVFMTPLQRSELTNEQVEILNQSGKKLVLIPDNVYGKVADNINTFEDVYKEYKSSFEYDFVEYQRLTVREREIFDSQKLVFDFLKSNATKLNVRTVPVKISETIRVDNWGNMTQGLYDPNENIVIIRRSVLSSKSEFLGVLTHELVHCYTGCGDNSRYFENELTYLIGILFDANLNSKNVETRKRRFSLFRK
jgi:hypothetical protein